MKIGFLINDLEAGGAERATVSLANYFVNHGCDTKIITFKDCDSFYPLDSKVEHCKVSFDEIEHSMSLKRLSGAVKRMFSIRSYVRSLNLDILIGMSFSMTWYTVFATMFTKTKSIGTERNNPYKYKSTALNTFLRRFFYRLCNGYIFQTKKSAEFFTDDLRSTDIVIPNAIFNESIYEMTPPESREKLICAVGRLTEQKRFDLLIDAFKKIENNIPNYTMLIFGEGELRESLEKQVETLDLKDKILLPGKNPDAVKIVNRATVFILSSDLEGMPNALMEAMAMGVPCVSTRCEMGPEELIENNENGILVNVGSSDEIAEAILRIINNKELSDKLSKNARNLINTHSIDKISEKWLNYLKNV